MTGWQWKTRADDEALSVAWSRHIHTLNMMAMTVIFRRIEIVIMYMSAIPNRNGRAGVRTVMMSMAIFEHHIPLRVMHMTTIWRWERRVRHI